jgi:prephenate dehydrogenase
MSGGPRPGVLGLGLIGGSLLQGLAAAGAEPLGADAEPAVAAAARGAGFGVVDGAAELAAGCDVVIVCVPPARAAAAVAELLDADPRVVVTDVASVKAPVLQEVTGRVDAAALERFLPAHPLAGAESRGWEAAQPGLLRDAVWAICPPTPAAAPAALCAVGDALDPLGARLLVCDAGEHDLAVAHTSHVPHVAAQALARLPGGGGLALSAALSGGAYRDMTRTARADLELWLGILGANRTAVTGGLRALVADLARLADAVESGDDEALATAWREGATARAEVDAIRWAEPAWEPATLHWPAWDGLLSLGRDGVLIRRPRIADGMLQFEQGRGSAPLD